MTKQFTQYCDNDIRISVVIENAAVRKKSEIKFNAQEKAYGQTFKGKIAQAKHDRSLKGKARTARYAQTLKCKARYTRYAQTARGKVTKARVHARRKRDLSYLPINPWFEGCNGHHINDEMVVHIPKELHQLILHRQDNIDSMKRINNAAFKWIATQEIL